MAMDSQLRDFAAADLRVSLYDGAAEKRTMYWDGRRYMVKFGYVLDSSNRETSRTSYVNVPVNEYIGSNVFAAVGLPTQHVMLGEWRGQSVVACEDFMQWLDPTWRLVHFKQLEISMPGEPGRSKARPEWEFVRHVIEDSPLIEPLRGRVMERFAAMTCVDALIGNFDRHSNNWGFITDGGANIVDLAPVYDCGSSLAPHLSRDEMRARLDDPTLMKEANVASPVMSMTVRGKRRTYAFFLTSDHAREFRRALVGLWPHLGAETTDRVVESVPGLDDLHRDFYRETLNARREYILRPAYRMALKEGLEPSDAVVDLQADYIDAVAMGCESFRQGGFTR